MPVEEEFINFPKRRAHHTAQGRVGNKGKAWLRVCTVFSVKKLSGPEKQLRLGEVQRRWALGYRGISSCLVPGTG